MAIIGALASFALSAQLFGEADYVVPPGRAAFPIVITVGPDGKEWFTENAGLKIGTITTAGAILEFSITGAEGLCGIATKPAAVNRFSVGTVGLLVGGKLLPAG